MSEALDSVGATTAGWLRLAAAPTFAFMACLTGVLSDGRAAMICGAGSEPSWLGGMIPMYLLMSVFHAPPWLKRLGQWRR